MKVNPLVRRCGEQGPRLPDLRQGFYCTRALAHPGAHRAELAGRVLDTWPQIGDIDRGRQVQPGQ